MANPPHHHGSNLLQDAGSDISQPIRPVRFRAVLVGALAGFFTLILLTGIPYFLSLKIGFSEQEIEAYITWPSVLLPLLILIAAMPAVLAGYVAGRISGFAEPKHGLFAAILICAVFVPIDFLDPSADPLWFDIFSYLPVLGGGWFGGWLARRASAAA